MKFDGRAHAQEIYAFLKQEVSLLVEQGIIPQMAVILVGQNPNSLSYIKQKKKWGAFIGAQISVYEFTETVEEEVLLTKIHELNMDLHTHGIIVQLPLPAHLDEKKLTRAVALEKDIDGFHENSPYHVPVAEAVLNILEKVYQETKGSEERIGSSVPSVSFLSWLKMKHIVVLGKGKTAGHPIIELLQKNNLKPIIIDHATANPEQSIKSADIVISCVGKVVLTKEMLKPGAILIGVGLHLRDDRKLQGDFIEKDIESIVSAYTPTPGGVGPVNVACLLQNLVTATKNLAS